jgi:hypothetical protein
VRIPGGHDLPASLDLDGFLARITGGGGPSQVTVARDGDTMVWEEHNAGECMCPLVRGNVVGLARALCGCAVHWLRMLVERHARRPARVELRDSVAGGGRNCVFRITLAPAAGDGSGKGDG